MRNSIIEGLKIRFEAIKEHKEDSAFLNFCIDYVDFVLGNDYLVPIIKGLIDNGKLHPRLLQLIYDYYMIIHLITDFKDSRYNHIKFPKFYDKKIEKRFNLHRNFCELVQNDYEVTKNNPESLRINSDLPIVRVEKNAYVDLQTLHIHLLGGLRIQEESDNKKIIKQKGLIDDKLLKEKKEKHILYLDSNGNLYRKLKNKRIVYSMSAGSDRFKIIEYLSKNRRYCSVDEILPNKRPQNIRTTIAKIKKNIEKYLKIKGNDFIQSKRDSGYRVNPKYRVKVKK